MDNKNLYKQIGERIKKSRKQNGLTQEKLAELMDVTPQMISAAENGSKGIRPENIIKFSNALNISCEYILTGNNGIYDFNTLSKLSKTIGTENLNNLIKIIRILENLNNSKFI